VEFFHNLTVGCKDIENTTDNEVKTKLVFYEEFSVEVVAMVAVVSGGAMVTMVTMVAVVAGGAFFTV